MNGFRTCIAFFFFIGLTAFAGGQPAKPVLAPYQSQIEAGPDENFDYAAVQLWMPTAPTKARGILCVVLHPLGRGGSTLAHPQPWIELARDENCALMSVSFAQSNDTTRDWCRADQGTGRALLASLSDIAHQSGVPALSSRPLVVVGVCAAGQFAFHLAAFAPTRVASFVTIGGGKHDLSKFKATASLPALLVMTPDRGPVVVQNLQSLYAEGESLSAPWQLASEPIAKYDEGLCSFRVISYLRQRLASLGNPEAVRAEAKPNPGTSADAWLQISICGMKLPPEITVEPSTVALGTMDSSAGIRTLPFTLSSVPSSSVDSILALSSNEAIQTTIRKDGPAQWHLECHLDPNKLSFGSSKLLIKVRFLARNKKVLGGAKAELNCFITGSVSWHPLSLNFGSVGTGQSSTGFLEIISNDGSPIRIEEVTSPYPWMKAMEQIGLKKTIIKCVARLPSNAQGNEFAGYLRVELKSPIHRSLRVLCYGSIDKIH